MFEKDENKSTKLEELETHTDPEATQLALKQNSAKNLANVRNASDGVYILDADANVIEASDSFCTMMGYRHDEIIGMNSSQWNVEHSGVETSESDAQQAQSRYETRHLRKDGTILDVEVSCSPFELNGMTVQFNSSRDITERKQHENHTIENECEFAALRRHRLSA